MPRPPSFPMPLPAQAQGCRNAALRPAPGKPPPGTYPAGLTSAARVQPRGCKGLRPLHEITLSSPFPPGRGVGGMGAKRYCYGRQIRKPEKPAHPPMPRPPSFPMPLPAQAQGCRGRSPPPHAGQAPAGHQQGRFKPVPPGFSPGDARGEAPRPTQGKPPPGTCPAGLTSAARVQPRGCKGQSPLHKKTKNSPFPGGEERSASAGWGDGGKQLLLRQANPATEKASPPPPKPRPPPSPMPLPAQAQECRGRSPPPHTGQAPAGYLPRRLNQCRPGSAPGMQGAKPLA